MLRGVQSGQASNNEDVFGRAWNSLARGEFSIVIAGLGATIQPRLAPLSAAYVLLMAIAGPVLARFTK